MDRPDYSASMDRPRKPPRAPAADGHLGLIERRMRVIADMQTFYEDLIVEDWGKLPDAVKQFLHSCSMGDVDRALATARELSDQLDNQSIQPEQVPIEIRRAVTTMLG